MTAKLNLIKNVSEEHLKAKVVLPNFPFCYLGFKCNTSTQVYEVTDISPTGMQLSLKNGEHQNQDQNVVGELHWNGDVLQLSGSVKWRTPSRMGVEFAPNTSIHDFLSVDNIVRHMKPIHQLDYPVEFPVKLKYWLRGDGPLELFVWKHSDGELSKFQFLILEDYIEWTDGHGLKTGKLFSKRDLKTPLLEEDEFTFIMDEGLDQDRLDHALEILHKIPEQHLTTDVIDFINMKLRH
jgi:hypothetical protein